MNIERVKFDVILHQAMKHEGRIQIIPYCFLEDVEVGGLPSSVLYVDGLSCSARTDEAFVRWCERATAWHTVLVVDYKAPPAHWGRLLGDKMYKVRRDY